MASIESVAPIFSTEYLVSETGSSGSALAVPNDDQPVANTHNIEDTEGWVLPKNGLCDFIPIKELSSIHALVLNDTQRLFRGIYRQPENKADLSLTWGESKGAGLVVWSYFVSKKKHIILPSGEIVNSMPKGTKFDQTTGRVKYRALLPNERTMDPKLHDEMGHNIRKACRKASGRLRALGFTRVVKGERTYKEMTWQIRQELTDNAGAELTTLRTSVPH
ncbi:hypothetical protein BBO_02000 [Beauveria brongniartii RCEF 3172]|uniref:Uncharacterized protein n=1 Tax=Beauveria brongniartii RCEF 3172 TaxID=1081107 RepID=A0A167IDI1_9HYPO|nr:hypothetical protein BBO_02000 [Beauveria brongniartii RCEF 3172]